MIAYLKGPIISKDSGRVVIDTGGIGYGVRISNHTFDRLPAVGSECSLHTYHHISETDQQLYGFAGLEEKNLFELLITVKSIGPRLALALLSAMSPKHIVNAIIQHESGLIAKSPGIGKKSAERIVLELKDKLGELNQGEASVEASGSLQQETVSALESLGYQRSMAQKAVRNVADQENESDSVSEMLKKALKYLQ